MQNTNGYTRFGMSSSELLLNQIGNILNEDHTTASKHVYDENCYLDKTNNEYRFNDAAKKIRLKPILIPAAICVVSALLILVF